MQNDIMVNRFFQVCNKKKRFQKSEQNPNLDHVCMQISGRWYGRVCFNVKHTDTFELPGVFVPYPDEGKEATDQRLPSVFFKGTKTKWLDGDMLRGLSSGESVTRKKPLNIINVPKV